MCSSWGLSHFPWQLGRRGAGYFPAGYCQGLPAWWKGCDTLWSCNATTNGPPSIMAEATIGWVCWGVGDGSWVRAMILLRVWASLQLKKGGLKSFWNPLGTLYWNQCPAHRAAPPTLLCSALVCPHPPCTTWFPDPKELGCLPCSPLCESWLAWKGGTRKTCAVFLARFHVLYQLRS